ncbi:hypothetical protein CYMTET_4081 [Cymbomonas tetramitiformis]|uniref:Uncharacterized protein n=1 Tax=Cymbomonas tetramitiformis TaxID=36881 RepID=A0AAE0H1V5_9CHLO|nr:hypothetical protein CYMTET_4081 [Cymbomonas tetramitiformis]
MSAVEKDSRDRSQIGVNTGLLRKVRSEGTVQAPAGLFADYTGGLARQESDDSHKPLNEVVNNILKGNAFDGDRPARQDDYCVKRFKDFQGTLDLYEENRSMNKRRKGQKPMTAEPEVETVGVEPAEVHGRAPAQAEGMAEHDSEGVVHAEGYAKGTKDIVDLSQSVLAIALKMMTAFEHLQRTSKITWAKVVEDINQHFLLDTELQLPHLLQLQRQHLLQLQRQ